MSIEALIQKARERGVKLSLMGGQIKYEGGREAVKALLDPLRQHKAELTHWLNSATASLSIDQPSEGPGVRIGPNNWNALLDTNAATMSCQSAPHRLLRQRGQWLTGTDQTAAKAYHAHHFNCRTCIAAGRGTLYGWRCAVGLALWTTYTGVDEFQTKGGHDGEARTV